MNTEFPLVSVIIPTYNRANLVVRAIDSVLSQTYKNIEIIVVDDGSKDNTKEVLAFYKDKIRYFYKENGGEASARNCGIERVKGDYIALLDSDDLWYPEKVEKQIQKLLSAPDFAISITDIDFVYESGKIVTRNLRKKIPHDGYILPYILKYPGFGCSSVLAKKEVFEKVGPFREEFYTGEDQNWMFKACSFFKVILLNESLVKMIVSPDSLSKSLFTKNRLKVLRKIKEYNPVFYQQYNKLILKTLSQVNLDYAMDLLWYRYVKEAQKQLLESWHNYPNVKALLLFIKTWLILAVSIVLPQYKDKGNFNER